MLKKALVSTRKTALRCLVSQNTTYVSRNGCVLSIYMYLYIYISIHTGTAAHPSSCQRYRAGSKRACTKLSFPLSLSYGSCLSLQTIPTFQAASLSRISQWSLKAGKNYLQPANWSLRYRTSHTLSCSVQLFRPLSRNRSG